MEAVCNFYLNTYRPLCSLFKRCLHYFLDTHSWTSNIPLGTRSTVPINPHSSTTDHVTWYCISKTGSKSRSLVCHTNVSLNIQGDQWVRKTLWCHARVKLYITIWHLWRKERETDLCANTFVQSSKQGGHRITSAHSIRTIHCSWYNLIHFQSSCFSPPEEAPMQGQDNGQGEEDLSDNDNSETQIKERMAMILVVMTRVWKYYLKMMQSP